ncbi:PGPGW domain-containing protein [Polycladomyces subterraneus]|uniref:Uncharacterized protein n=1 Tax=Polycladomyces subterraneus TaxID=1016997 RepID=A0ABT8IR33_9BACL|nr:PGPGW domain-containing protein [Polycladomyces subterraneus]MDN4594857.1 hypothetical protein [Polycladomyces subterraneus]
MNSNVKRILLTVGGWFFLFLGVLGLFLPVLQGVLFLLIGLYLLSFTSPWARRLLMKLRARYPKLAERIDRFKKTRKIQQLFRP